MGSGGGVVAVERTRVENRSPTHRSPRLVVFYLGYAYTLGYAMTFEGYAKTSDISQNETQELLDLLTSSDPRTQEDSSPK
jgi:hypothetical protein